MIHVGRPIVDGNETKYVMEALRHEQLSAGPYVERFEREFAQYVGARYAVATTSGTTALHLALAALGIGRRQEVIVPSLTFIATASAVKLTGALPVFVDVLPDSWTLDPDAVRRAITPQTRAIVPVHLYGNPAEMNELRAIGEAFGLYVIEDAAESLGSRYRGEMTGTLGKAGVFSFYGNKLISTGEGGMLVTNDRELALSALELRNHGRPGAENNHMTEWQRPYFHVRAGFNYRMMELQGALGVAQLERIDARIQERRQLRALYEEALGRFARWQAAPLGCDVVWWMNAALVDWPAAMALRLREAGIETRPVFWPLDGLPVAWRSRPKSGAAQSKVAERIHRSGIVLPSHGGVSAEDVERISELIISGSRERL